MTRLKMHGRSVTLSAEAKTMQVPLRRRANMLGFPGFTLVELLVVVGIIAILISFLLPTLSSVRQQAKSTQCLSNVRQLGNSFSIYIADNRGWLFCQSVGLYRWPRGIQAWGYLGGKSSDPQTLLSERISNVTLCPTSFPYYRDNGDVLRMFGGDQAQADMSAYGFNGMLPVNGTYVRWVGVTGGWDFNSGYRPFNMSLIAKKASQHVLLGDSLHLVYPFVEGVDMQVYDVDNTQNGWHFRHRDAGNFLMGDMSGQRIEFKRAWEQVFKPMKYNKPQLLSGRYRSRYTYSGNPWWIYQ
jgi:prepilin-type N-terminal cleavage/methylation domain-containing protein